MAGLASAQAEFGPTTTHSFLWGEAGVADLLRPPGLWLCLGGRAGDGGDKIK